MKERKDKRFLISVTLKMHKELSHLAWKNKKSLNGYITDLFSEHLKESGCKNEQM